MPDLVCSAPLLTTNAAFDLLRPEWDALARQCPTATVFQSFAWSRAWWAHFGRGRRLQIVTLRDAAGQLVAILPLYQAFWYGTPVRVLRLIGTGASDYCDALVVPGMENAAQTAFGAALRRLKTWHVLDFQPLRDGGFLRECPLPFPVWEQAGEPCPYLTLPPSWEDLRAKLGKKTRANIGYYDRALRKAFAVDVSFVTDAGDLDAQLSHLFALHGRRWRGRALPGVFSSPRVRAFHRDAARRLLDENALRLWTLKVDGRTAVSLYCFSWNGRVCYYQGGWEPSLARFSPGTVLTAQALSGAISEGASVFDFLRGAEPYKLKWTTAARVNLRRLYARTSGLLGFARRVAQTEADTEARVKQWAAQKNQNPKN